MRPFLPLLLAGSALLSACQLPGLLPAASSARKQKITQEREIRRPDFAIRIVRGRIRIDANYAIAAGGGNLQTVNGGMVIAAGGGNLIGNAAGNLIGQSGTNFRTLTVPRLQIGTMLPVMGMRVELRSLVTGQALGEHTLTDQAGYYQLALPPSSREANVLVQAEMPLKPDDPRLRYSLLASADSESEAVIDEVTSIVTRYLREVFGGKLALALTPGSESASPTIAVLRSALPASLLARAEADPEGVKTFAPRIADLLLAHVPLEKLTYEDGTRVMDFYVKTVTALDRATAAKMEADGGGAHFKAFFQKAGVTGVDIVRPSDLAQVLVSHYLSKDLAAFQEMGRVVNALGLDFKLTEADMAHIGQGSVAVARSVADELGAEGDAEKRTQLETELQALWPAQP